MTEIAPWTSRLGAVFAVVVPAAIFGHACGAVGIGAAVATAALASLAIRSPFALARSAVIAVTLGAMALGSTVGYLAASPGHAPLAAPWASIALGALGVATLLLYLRPRRAGAIATVVPGLVALAACGETRSGVVYPMGIAATLAAILVALRQRDPGRPSVATVPRQAWLMTAALLGVGGIVFAAIAWKLPPLQRWTTGALVDVLAAPQTGFSDRLWLGSLDGMLQSEDLVMRVDGAPTDYLRGAVYDRYEGGRWITSHPAGKRGQLTAVSRREIRGDTPSTTRITVVGGPKDRYFLPLGAHAVSTREDSLAADRFGVLYVWTRDARLVTFDSAGTPDLPSADPAPEDLVVPADLRPTLDRLVAEWTSGAVTPEAKVQAIAAHLRNDFRYSLHYRRRRTEPLLDFLLDDRRGHCEYFASALALAARTAGVPARLAVGYRVDEWNSLGGYYVVREKNAHAWAEVSLPGRGFTTVDATPDSGDPARDRPTSRFLAEAMDLLRSLTGRALLWCVDTPKTKALVVVATLVAFGVAMRLRKRRARRSPPSSPPVVEVPRCLDRLLAELARRGTVRSPSEPLERFAARLADDEQLQPLATLLKRFATLRYGGTGDGAALSAELDRWTSRLRGSP